MLSTLSWHLRWPRPRASSMLRSSVRYLQMRRPAFRLRALMARVEDVEQDWPASVAISAKPAPSALKRREVHQETCEFRSRPGAADHAVGCKPLDCPATCFKRPSLILFDLLTQPAKTTESKATKVRKRVAGPQILEKMSRRPNLVDMQLLARTFAKAARCMCERGLKSYQLLVVSDFFISYPKTLL